MCSLEFSDLETNVWQRYRDKGVVVVGVDAGGLFEGDTDEIVQRFIRQTGVTFPVGFDDNSSYRRFRPPGGVSPFPVDVVVDRTGKVAYAAPKYDAAAMAAVIDSLVK